MNKETLDMIRNGLCLGNVQLPPNYVKDMHYFGGKSMDFTNYFDYEGVRYFHKERAPATRIGTDVFFEYNGFVLTKTKSYCYLCELSDEETCIWVLKYGDYLPKYVDKL